MRELRTYGSVRGAQGNLRPYRDRPLGCPIASHRDARIAPALRTASIQGRAQLSLQVARADRFRAGARPIDALHRAR